MGFFFQGLSIGLAYVAPIGLQNLFVINGALTHTRSRALATALIGQLLTAYLIYGSSPADFSVIMKAS